jgi:hypothetical protein
MEQTAKAMKICEAYETNCGTSETNCEVYEINCGASEITFGVHEINCDAYEAKGEVCSNYEYICTYPLLHKLMCTLLASEQFNLCK